MMYTSDYMSVTFRDIGMAWPSTENTALLGLSYCGAVVMGRIVKKYITS